VLINSINLEDGGANLEKVCALAKKHGAGVVALAIGKEGMAMTTADKIAVAKDIYHRAVDGHGLRPKDIFFDMLTFAIGSGDPSLKRAAVETMDAIREIKRVLPGVYTVLGVSNISFGLPKAGRKVLTSVFLHEAIEAGLDAAIIDAAKILPLSAIPEEDREICLDLLYYREKEGAPDPLDAFIEHFKDRKETASEEADKGTGKTPEQRLETKLITGDPDDLLDLLTILMERYSPIHIINEILVPTMRRIGELFGRGEMLLPFVLKSAEVMKRSVSLLEPYMEKQEGASRTRIVLATVQGDVHDIGKNLVDIILSNNGFEVINIGINAPVEKIIEAARANEVHAIGLSGLLVKSAMVMKETMPRYAEAGVDVPILLGGAALTPQFVAESCVTGHSSSVVYCADAFAGLKAMQQVEDGTVTSTVYLPKKEKPGAGRKVVAQDIERLVEIPAPPFFGARHVRDIDTGALLRYLNKQALFRGRWGYRRAKMTADEYAAVVREKVDPLFDTFAKRAINGDLGEARAAYGYYQCRRDGDSLIVIDGGKEHALAFPRQSFPPHFCISDFFRSGEEGEDVAGFFVVTLGDRLAQEIRALYDSDNYHDYLMLHGFAVELTDALAEHWHAVMRKELGIARDEPDNPHDYATQRYQGSRYGFGYPACPDLDAHKVVFELLDPAAVGVTLTESMEMVPELSTSAIVVHHRQAKYFSV
jgi:5-methyltetrahydrofolate--homocysteine methyltransferase